MPNQIIIVTERLDPHADDVINCLKSKKADVIRLNTDDLYVDITSILEMSKNSIKGYLRNEISQTIIDLDQIRSVWWRRPGPFRLPLSLTEQEADFASKELMDFMHGFLYSTDCYWMSRPSKIMDAGRKPEQLRRASALGFRIPHTLICSDLQKATEFYHLHSGQIICKVLTDPRLGSAMYPDNPIAFSTPTTLIKLEQLESSDQKQIIPCMFQEYIPKQTELRVTIIGDDIFVGEIFSQESEASMIDWRSAEENITWKKAVLPDDVASRCLEFVRSYDLQFSAMDLILTPEGDYVFLENNPNGNFIFVEKLIPELELTEALASRLLRG